MSNEFVINCTYKGNDFRFVCGYYMGHNQKLAFSATGGMYWLHRPSLKTWFGFSNHNPPMYENLGENIPLNKHISIKVEDFIGIEDVVWEMYQWSYNYIEDVPDYAWVCTALSLNQKIGFKSVMSGMNPMNLPYQLGVYKDFYEAKLATVEANRKLPEGTIGGYVIHFNNEELQ